MTTRHTPGPYAFKDGMVYSEATGATLAVLPYHGDEPEQIATGILLAAAPELLSAMNECLADLEHYVAAHGPGPDTRLARFKAAINKAEAR